MNLKALVPAKTPAKYDLCTLKRRGVLAVRHTPHYPRKNPDPMLRYAIKNPEKRYGRLLTGVEGC